MRVFLQSAMLIGTALGVGWAVPAARAQLPYGPYQRTVPGYRTPVVSPYLNLFRNGADPAVNYYGLVRPQMDFASGLQNLQQQVTDLSQAQALGLTPGFTGATGHPTMFFNYSHYYPGLGGGGFGVGRTGLGSSSLAAG